MRLHLPSVLAFAVMLSACASSPPPIPRAEAQRQVMATERAFAKTMADRDRAAFATFLDTNAVFFSGPRALHGKGEVVSWWARFYAGPNAPFSWEPDTVEALESGDLALSTGPVYDPGGKRIGRFNSIWRRERDSTWRVVFDKSEGVCDCKRP